MVDPSARFEEVKIPLAEPVHGLDSVSGVLVIPEWWPTGSRVGIVLAHGTQREDPILEELHRELTHRKYLTLRFCFPFVEAEKKRPDDIAILQRTFLSAVALLGRDPTASPAHLFIGGKNLGALVAAHAATARVRIAGLFFLGYPLHKQGDASNVRSERLFRVISPMLFLQGTRDRHCDLDVLRQTLLRVGAPWDLHTVEEADHGFKVLKKGERTQEEVQAELLTTMDDWVTRVIGE